MISNLIVLLQNIIILIQLIVNTKIRFTILINSVNVFYETLIELVQKNTATIEYNRFIVTVNTNSHFLIRYPQKDHTPKIGECLSGNWTETIHIIKRKKLFIEIFVNNQKKATDLLCEVIIQEVNEQNQIINPSYFPFTIGTDTDKSKWTRFEIPAILD